jgi:hypothetical protein
MSESVVVPMTAGEKPTVPGWYVVEHPNTDREIVLVTNAYQIDRGDYLAIEFAGNELWYSVGDQYTADLIWLGRIQSDLLAGEFP